MSVDSPARPKTQIGSFPIRCLVCIALLDMPEEEAEATRQIIASNRSPRLVVLDMIAEGYLPAGTDQQSVYRHRMNGHA